MLANLVLWRSIYEFESRLYVDAIRAGPFSEPRIYSGESVDKFVLKCDLRALAISRQDYSRSARNICVISLIKSAKELSQVTVVIAATN